MSIQNDVEKLYRSDLEKQRQKQKKKKKKTYYDYQDFLKGRFSTFENQMILISTKIAVFTVMNRQLK